MNSLVKITPQSVESRVDQTSRVRISLSLNHTVALLSSTSASAYYYSRVTLFAASFCALCSAQFVITFLAAVCASCIQYGFNRISNVCQLHMAGYNFHVLDSPFLIHKGFKEKGEFHAEKDLENSINRDLYSVFRRELQLRYPESSKQCV